MVSKKENYLMCLRGEQPEWVPSYTFGAMPGDPEPPVNQMFEPNIVSPHRNFAKPSETDLWGVRYVTTESTMGAGMPANDSFILPLEGLTHWQDYIKIPDFSGVDWEQECRQQMEEAHLQREFTTVELAMHFGYFQTLMSWLGFENGMIALYEFPDEVKEMLDTISDFYMDVADHVMPYFDPDVLCLVDDTAAWNAPFVSAEMYDEFFYPNHDKYAKRARERGLLINMHNCGRCESVVPTFRRMGVNGWNPAQTSNDLAAIKREYGNSLVIMGGWDGRERLMDPMVSDTNPGGLTEEELRQSVRDAMDAFAPGGGFMWCGGFLMAAGDDENMRKNMIIFDEVEKYGKDFYKTH